MTLSVSDLFERNVGWPAHAEQGHVPVDLSLQKGYGVADAGLSRGRGGEQQRSSYEHEVGSGRESLEHGVRERVTDNLSAAMAGMLM